VREKNAGDRQNCPYDDRHEEDVSAGVHASNNTPASNALGREPARTLMPLTARAGLNALASRQSDVDHRD
jgi:hypothetical protein